MKSSMGQWACAAVAVAAFDTATADTVAWWRFGDGAAGTAAMTLANAVDATKLSGKAHSINAEKSLDADDSFRPVFVSNSFQGVYDPATKETYADPSALRFLADDSGNGGLVLVPDDASLHLKTFTLEFFFRWEGESKPGWRTLVGMKSGVGTSFCLRLHQNEGFDTIAVWFNSEDGTQRTANCGKLSVSDGKWHHVAMKVYEQDSAWKASVYVDYKHVGAPTLAGPIYYSGEKPLFIGGDPDATGGRFIGSIDEVRLSDTLLGEDVFLRQYAISPNAGADTALYLDFSSNTIANQVSNEPPTSVTATLKGDTTTSDDVPGATVRANVWAADGTVNTAALHFAANAENASASGQLSFDDRANRVSNGDFTAEMFFKIDDLGEKSNSSGDCVYLFCAPTWKLRIMRGEGKLSGYYPNGMQFTSGLSVVDGLWHHVALVYDKTSEKMRVYLDGTMLWEGSVGSLATEDTKFLTTIAGNMWDTVDKYQIARGAIDEVRITRRALKPAEFLTVAPYASGKLIHLTYEENVLDSCVNAQVFGGGWTNNAANPPTLSGRVPGKALLDAAGAVVRETNAHSLRYDGRYLAYESASVLDRADFTLEFFCRASATKPTAGVMRLVDNKDVDDFVWGLRTDATGKTLELVASTEAEANTVVATYPADSLDGRWHHYAANFRTDGANTVVTLYRDYEQVAQSTLNGVLAVATGVSRFYVGGGSAGHLDEIVVWDGEKRADDFLRAKKSGAVLIIR